MPITHRTTTHRLDCTTLGTFVLIPVAEFTSMMLQLDPVGTTVSTAVLTLERGLNPASDFFAWAGTPITISAAGISPTTKVHNVAGFSFVRLRVSTAQADLSFIITCHVNDSLLQTIAL